MPTTLGQQRAAYCLDKIRDLDNSLREDFESFTAGLPAMILQNGFGQALAFLKAKAKGQDKHQAAFEIITTWLVQREILREPSDDADLLSQLSKMDQKKYLQAQRETLAMLEWLKRYANAKLFVGE